MRRRGGRGGRGNEVGEAERTGENARFRPARKARVGRGERKGRRRAAETQSAERGWGSGEKKSAEERRAPERGRGRQQASERGGAGRRQKGGRRGERGKRETGPSGARTAQVRRAESRAANKAARPSRPRSSHPTLFRHVSTPRAPPPISTDPPPTSAPSVASAFSVPSKRPRRPINGGCIRPAAPAPSPRARPIPPPVRDARLFSDLVHRVPSDDEEPVDDLGVVFEARALKLLARRGPQHVAPGNPVRVWPREQGRHAVDLAVPARRGRTEERRTVEEARARGQCPKKRGRPHQRGVERQGGQNRPDGGHDARRRRPNDERDAPQRRPEDERDARRRRRGGAPHPQPAACAPGSKSVGATRRTRQPPVGLPSSIPHCDGAPRLQPTPPPSRRRTGGWLRGAW